MDLRLLKQFAEQDLQASKSAVEEAQRKIDSISKAAKKEGRIGESSPQIRDLKELTKKPFQLRLDYKDWDSGRIGVVYLTKVRKGIVNSSVKIAPWTSPWARIRFLDVGDNEDIKIGGQDLSITLQMKGEYEQSAPDIRNARYILEKETLILDSASALLGEDTKVPEVPPQEEEFGLPELVLTIDFEQDKTMRFPMRGFLRIEGVPGSGKTTVAIQRIAYLIDRQYDELQLPSTADPLFSQEKTVVLVLSEVLEIYLKRLLEDLDLTTVNTVSFNRFVTEFLAQAGFLSGAEIKSSGESSPWLELLKTRYEILTPLRSFSQLFMEQQIENLLPLVIEEFDHAVPRRYRAIATRIGDALSAFEKRIQKSLSLKDLLVDLAQIERTVPKSGKTRNAWERLNAQLVATLRSIWNPFNILTNFYSSAQCDAFLKEAVDREWIKKHHRPQVKEILSEMTQARRFTENDLALAAVVYLWSLSGVRQVPDIVHYQDWLRPLPVYSHIVIDEIQDFTEIQTRFIGHLMQDELRCITAVGDLTQKLRWPEGLESWERTGLFAKGHEVTLGVFKTNYRQTYQLGKLAYEYYGQAFHGEPPFEPVSKMEGRRPGLTVVRGLEREIAAMVIVAKEMVRVLMSPTIAVIVEDESVREQYAEELSRQLAGTIDCHLSTGTDLKKLEVLHVVSLDDVKGLEFDAVAISDANKILHSPKTESAARTAKNRLYVAITRARKLLQIFCHRTIPPILWQLRRELNIKNTYRCRSCNSLNRISESLGSHTVGLICPQCKEYQAPTFVTKDLSPVGTQSP